MSDDTGSALVVYHASLREGAEPQPHSAKVAELHWASEPAALHAQVSADTLASWEALDRWRVERETEAPA